MLPKVTVLMTVYNGERYLKECMDSVLDQSFKNFEFLIIDDCSTDRSKGIVKSYRDDRIRLIENENNLNQVRSLNIGLEHARGIYVARMDQDDIMASDRLKRQVDFLEKNRDISVFGAWGEVIDENGRVFTRTRLPLRNEEIVGSVLFCGYFLMHPSVVFRKNAVMDAGKYDEKISFSEDYNLWTRLLLKKHKFANIPAYLIKFRQHKKSSSRQFPETQLNNVRISISNFIKAIIGDCLGSDLDSLCDILVNAGVMNKAFWADGMNTADLERIAGLMEMLLRKTASYFNFNKRQTRLLRKVFCNRMLNFLYEAPRKANKKTLPLYLFCLRNYLHLFLRPKLYLYPLKVAL